MYLYEQKGKVIDVYSFESKKQDLIEYRERLLSNEDREDLFYQFETTNQEIRNKFKYEEEIDISFLDHKDLDVTDWWSEIRKEIATGKTQQIEQEELLKRYINGEFAQTLPIRTFALYKGVSWYLRNLLVTSKEQCIYSNIEKRNYYRFNSLINLPDKLCALQLLENGEFSQILDTQLDYEEPLKLFNIEKISSINASQVERMFTFGLLEENYDKVMQKVKTTQEILHKMDK